MNDVAKKSVISRLRDVASAHRKRIVFPESEDPRVVEAAIKLAQRKLVIPVLIGHSTAILPPEIETIRLDDAQLKEQCSQRLFEHRRHKGLSLEAARLAVDEPLLFAATLVSIGAADGSVAGSMATTASVIRAGLYGVGMRAGSNLVSSFFLMQFPDFCLTYADCGVVPDPDAEQLAEIAIASAENHRRLTGEVPKVALLSFSTKGSADHPRVGKVREALRIAKSKAPNLLIDGELQFDAAFFPEIAARKAAGSTVAGHANVFIFPDLDSGNIAYKISERLAGATALGPLVQGLAKPCMDLSRGCSVEDIVDVAVIAGVLSQ